MFAIQPKPASLLFLGIMLVLWVGWIALTYWMGRYGSWGYVDFHVYHEAAGYFARGESPYFGAVGLFFLYPPLLGQALIPLAALDLISAWQVWFVANLVILVGTLFWFQRASAVTWTRLLWLSPLLFEPILDAFYIGQVTIIILALVTGAWIARRKGQPFLAGALIAAAAWLKVYPAFLALYFIWKRDWQVVRGIIAAGIVLALLQIAISGLDPFIDSFSVVFDLAGGGQPTKVATSSSILGFAAQWFTTSPRVLPVIDIPLLFTISRIALTAGVLITLALLTARRFRLPPRADTTTMARFDLEYSLALLTALLLSPTLWASGMPPLLLCFWLLWRAGSRIVRYLIAFALVLITCHSWFMIGYEGAPPLSAAVLSFGFYALVMLWGVHVWLLIREKRLPDEHS